MNKHLTFSSADFKTRRIIYSNPVFSRVEYSIWVVYENGQVVHMWTASQRLMDKIINGVAEVPAFPTRKLAREYATKIKESLTKEQRKALSIFIKERDIANRNSQNDNQQTS